MTTALVNNQKRKFWHLSLRSRISLAFFMLALLVVLVSASSFWLSTSTQNNLDTIRLGIQQIEMVANLKLSRRSISASMDSLLLTREPSLIENQIQTQLNEFDGRLASIQTVPLSRNAQIAADNQKIIADLETLGNSYISTVGEFLQATQDGNWTHAYVVRNTQLAPVEQQLDDELTRLSDNVHNDIQSSTAQVRNAQQFNRLVWIISVLAAILAAAIFGFFASRMIARPIGQLIALVERVAQRDFTPVIPLKQQDEMGDLSRSFALLIDLLRESYETLEQRVFERTADLERRTLQVQVAAQVAREIASTQGMEELLNHAVNLIRDRFGFYHAGIFLMDARGEYAVLYAATGEAGRSLLADGHRLKVGETGLVGHVTGTGESRIALDVGEDAVHFKNPFLPKTRSELALPLKLSKRVIGALDVQSEEPSAFDQEDVTILQVVADQLTVAIENTRLLNEARQHLKELETFYAEHGRKAWEQIGRSRSVIGFQSDQNGITPVLVSQGVKNDQGEPERQPVTFPLEVRGETIGFIDVWPEENNLSAQESDFLQTISSRLSQTMESARLFEEARNRAYHEQAINAMTSRISRSMDMETLLSEAVQELSNLPGVMEISVHVGAADPLQEASGEASQQAHTPGGNGKK